MQEFHKFAVIDKRDAELRKGMGYYQCFCQLYENDIKNSSKEKFCKSYSNDS